MVEGQPGVVEAHTGFEDLGLSEAHYGILEAHTEVMEVHPRLV
jgi:hypothetical protein